MTTGCLVRVFALIQEEFPKCKGYKCEWGGPSLEISNTEPQTSRASWHNLTLAKEHVHSWLWRAQGPSCPSSLPPAFPLGHSGGSIYKAVIFPKVGGIYLDKQQLILLSNLRLVFRVGKHSFLPFGPP